MAKVAQLSIVLLIGLLMVICLVRDTDANCFETWSRCSSWSSGATGILWKGCDKHCKEDLGKNGGNCVLVDAKDCWMTDKAYQCQCY